MRHPPKQSAAVPPVNHYERLKVTQDAPPEVIRAAYRALANRLHPDRSGADAVGGDAHEQMVALNAAYEVLIDPALRRDYDDSLSPARAWMPSGEDALTDEREPSMGAVPADLAAPVSAWAPETRHLVAACSIGLALLTAGAFWYLKPDSTDSPIDVAMNGQLAHQASSPGVDALQPHTAGGAGRRPSVEELARMSDEELVAAMPALDGQEVAPAKAPHGAQAHPLDGPGLPLKTDRTLLGAHGARPAGRKP